jgi:hypothetical protein
MHFAFIFQLRDFTWRATRSIPNAIYPEHGQLLSTRVLKRDGSPWRTLGQQDVGYWH